MIVFIPTIEWPNGDEGLSVGVHLSRREAIESLVDTLIATWEEADSLFKDEAPDFMGSSKSLKLIEDPHRYDVDFLEAWLLEFREATTSPWWEIHEREL